LRYFVELAIDKQLEELLANLSAMLSQLEDATRQRKQLEGIIEFCQHWFKQADINLAVEIRNSTTPEILVEHIMVVREKIPVLFIILVQFFNQKPMNNSKLVFYLHVFFLAKKRQA
jgi:hypothetical protein